MEMSPFVPGTQGTFAARATALPALLKPSFRLASGGGPMKTKPRLAQASAKSAFSERKP